MRRAALLLVLGAMAAAGEIDAAERSVQKAAALARKAVVTVITPEARDLDVTGVVIATGVVLTVRSPLLLKDGTLPESVPVRLPGRGTTLDAELLDDDEETNTALYRMTGSHVKPLTTARGEDVHHGMWVLLLGNTFGAGRESTPTLGLGVVSAISRDKEGLRAFHASVLVNPGSVGAPVVDLTGDLIGIAAPAITSDGGQTIVIPYDAIRRTYRQKDGKGARVVGREPPPHRSRGHIADALGEVLEDAARRASPSLVAVRALPLQGEGDAPTEPPPPPKPEAGKPPPGPPPPPRVPGAEPGYDRSSGLIVGADGLVLCPLRITGWPNATRELVVDLLDGRSFPAQVLGRDERLRLALLKIKASDLPVLEKAPEESFRAGGFAVALGYPHMDPTRNTPQLTFGIISRTGALSRLHPAFNALGTDAGVSETNRGGPLIDVDGRLLGVLIDVNDADVMGYMTRARGAYRGNAGLGFAVPWTTLDQVVPRMAEGAVLKAAFLGVGTKEADGGLQVVNVSEKNSKGDPPAAKTADIKKGDVILAINGRPIRTTRELRAVLGELSAGDKATIRLRRGETEREIEATLGEP